MTLTHAEAALLVQCLHTTYQMGPRTRDGVLGFAREVERIWTQRAERYGARGNTAVATSARSHAATARSLASKMELPATTRRAVDAALVESFVRRALPVLRRAA